HSEPVFIKVSLPTGNLWNGPFHAFSTRHRATLDCRDDFDPDGLVRGTNFMHVLIIEDDEETATYLAKGLRESGHVTDRVATGPDGLRWAQASVYDALIVDRMLPALDGLNLVRKLRANGNETPVLF